MTMTVRQVLDCFENLSDADKHQAAIEILRRYTSPAEGDVAEAVLVETADELFRALLTPAEQMSLASGVA
jgi:hypothetical protein